MNNTSEHTTQLPPFEQYLKNYWGYSEFRKNQKKIIQHIYNQKDTVVLMPTGGGKSLCYQIPALASEGTALIISPLLALMKDQVQALQSIGIPACYISSEQNAEEQQNILHSIVDDQIKLLYVSPERLQQRVFVDTIKNINISFIAVDEAHCISEWGQDFRPAYQHIKDFNQKLGRLPIIALTATATPKVLQDIIKRLNLQYQTVFQTSFLRENLKIQCIKCEDKTTQILSDIKKIQGPSLIYVQTRKQAEYLHKDLIENGIDDCNYFHAGLPKDNKTLVQQHFLQSKSAVLVATTAFGMGIDKDNIRAVFHYAPPYSLENYYQEIGRAGRDGKPSDCILYFSDKDIKEMVNRWKRTLITKQEYKSVVSSIIHQFQLIPGELPEQALEFQWNVSKNSLPENKYQQILSFLEASNWFFITENMGKCAIKITTSPEILSNSHTMESRVLEHLSRLLPGIYSDWVYFTEEEIIQRLKIPKNDFEKIISTCIAMEYIQYKEGNKKYIQFLLPRQDSFFVSYLWGELKRHQQYKGFKIKELAFFLQNTSYCRMQLIISYFGEKNNYSCGHCDVCTNKRKQFDIQELLDFIQTPKNLEEIQHHFPHYKKEIIVNKLQELLSQDKINYTESHTFVA